MGLLVMLLVLGTLTLGAYLLVRRVQPHDLVI